jgi:ABC-type glycerol-3-phosphate transport system substrate-binding protein
MRSLSRREFLRGSVAAGLAPIAAAALGGTAAPGAEGAAVRGAINFWSRETFNNGARMPVLRDWVAAFDKSHGTRTSVQFMTFQESIAKTQASLAANNPPDLGEQGPDVGTQFAAGGHLLDLTAVANDLKNDFVGMQRDAYITAGGRIYGIPWWSETRVLFYHKDLLDRAGVRPPTTWDEWVDAARKLTTGDQYGFAVNMDGTWPGQLWVPLGISNGGRVIDKGGKVVADSPEMREALQFITDFYSKHKTMPPAIPTYKSNDLVQLFTLKKVAMLVYNGELLQSIEQTRPDLLRTIGAVTLPVNKRGQVSRSFLGGFDLFVFAKSANPDGAAALLRYLYDKGWYTRYTAATYSSSLPVLKDTVRSDFYQRNELTRVLLQQLTTAVRYGGPDFGNTSWTGAAEGKFLFNQPMVDVMNGKRSVAQGLAEMSAQLTALAKS